jgi:hypothetical protein
MTLETYIAGGSEPSLQRRAMKPNDEVLLTRSDTAAALTEAGFPISAATLATKATRGGGPPYRLFGRKPLYEWGSALDWAQSHLSDPVTNSSEARAV